MIIKDSEDTNLGKHNIAPFLYTIGVINFVWLIFLKKKEQFDVSVFTTK